MLFLLLLSLVLVVAIWLSKHIGDVVKSYLGPGFLYWALSFLVFASAVYVGLRLAVLLLEPSPGLPGLGPDSFSL